jgi:sortase A
VGGTGKVLIAVGLLLFAFVAYQLWGTGIEQAQAQNQLEDEFNDLQATLSIPPTTLTPPPSTDATEPTTPGETTTTTTLAPIPLAEGDPFAALEIPRIGVAQFVVAGVRTDDLKKGPGHYPTTPFPGELGNSAIAGHRTTFGEPFLRLDELEVGDEIIITTLDGLRYVYRVTGTLIVTPDDFWVVSTSDPERATLTLTTCHPRYSARERLIVFAELDEAVSSPVGDRPFVYTDPTDLTEIPAEDVSADTVVPTTEVPTTDDSSAPSGTDVTATTEPTVDTTVPTTAAPQSVDAFDEGWFSDPDAWPQIALWGFILTAIALASYLVSRLARSNWAGLAVGIVPFVVSLYFFFQNVNRLLPPNL